MPPRQEDVWECPEENLLLDFMAGGLSAPDAERLHLHLDRCGPCQRLVGELARAETLESALESSGAGADGGAAGSRAAAPGDDGAPRRDPGRQPA